MDRPSIHVSHPPASTSSWLDGLNPQQIEAVTHGAGPLLVLAGAGSGKTRVIVHRIAWLIGEAGVPPELIVAVTFTNKAAGEMRERVERLLGAESRGAWIGTFHALCLRILRRDGPRIAIGPGFEIYDTDDQLALVKRILKSEESDPSSGTPRAILSRISKAKNALETPETYARRAFNPEAKLAARVYAEYEQALRASNAVDFDDLLVKTLELFEGHPELARRYADRCLHLLVDEYQDTNRPQYLLVRHLASSHGNVCVVGDEDQSIYRFRGAEIRNILEFEADHAGTRTIRLEQNYRSTGTIIQAASTVIANNVRRKGKTLWTSNPPGEKIELCRAIDDRGEAAWIARRIVELSNDTSREGIAVLYRTNAQSRQIEERLRSSGIAYRVVGSVQFYERREIKDLLAYLKLAVNPADEVAFRRVVNVPARGIGDSTLQTIETVARASREPLLAAAMRAVADGQITGRAARGLTGFLDLIADVSTKASKGQLAGLVEQIVDAIDYTGHLTRTFPGEAQDRVENVRALVSAAVEYVEEAEEPTLQNFLDRLALVSDADEVGRGPGVTLMTIHCAKGLEYPVVFLAGLEENIFPHAMSSGKEEDLEEERRLCYVALTRAKRRLLLSCAQFRRIQGALLPNPPSRFLEEIPTDLVREVIPPLQGAIRDAWTDRTWGNRNYGSSESSAARLAAKRASAAPTPTVRASRTAPPPPDGLAPGKWVLHPQFGSGQILDREGEGKSLKLTIFFSDYGSKKILPAYTRLELRVD
jgi:DNA helicase-2/ATP-dependent DNA helicase PcrA